MITYCAQCKVAYVVEGDEKQLGVLRKSKLSSFACPSSLCRGRTVLVQAIPHEATSIAVPFRSYYRAIHGFGFMSEQRLTASEVQKVLVERKLVDVVADDVSAPERVILRELVFEDGSRLHLAASSKGACAYYLEEAGNVNVSRDVSEDREEDRRGSKNCETVVGGFAEDHGGITATVVVERPILPAVPETSDLRS